MQNLSSFEKYLIKYYLTQKLTEMRINGSIWEKTVQLQKDLTQKQIGQLLNMSQTGYNQYEIGKIKKTALDFPQSKARKGKWSKNEKSIKK